MTISKDYASQLTSMTLAASLLAFTVLPGCQLLTGYKQIDEATSAKNWSGKIYPVAGEVNIACLGTYHCEIARIDQTPVISPETHKPVDASRVVIMPDPDKTPLFDTKSLKIVPLSTSGISGLTNYYARVKPIKREVQVNFYPENNLAYVERFAIIHQFVAATYQLRAYTMKSSKESVSLLDNASPDPLCVELIQDDRVERRFCKQIDTERQGEFVETGLFDGYANSPFENNDIAS